jgi:CelD/BcsL family acetyltransferase involved in cellulose biosynthesis
MRWLKFVFGMALNIIRRAGRAQPVAACQTGGKPLIAERQSLSSRQRLQLAKQVSKHVKNLALQIKAAARPTPAKAPAQTPTASPSGGSGN